MDWVQERLETGGIKCRGQILGEMTGTQGHFGGKVETQYKGNSMESLRVTLAKSLSNGGHRV